MSAQDTVLHPSLSLHEVLMVARHAQCSTGLCHGVEEALRPAGAAVRAQLSGHFDAIKRALGQHYGVVAYEEALRLSLLLPRVPVQAAPLEILDASRRGRIRRTAAAAAADILHRAGEGPARAARKGP